MAKDDRKRANLELVATKKYIIGIDPCSTRMDCVILDRNGLQVGKAFKCKFSWDGFSKEFEERFIKQIPGASLEEVVIGIEHSLNFWQHIVFFMQNKGVSIVKVNPMGVKYARKMDGLDLNKTDVRDAKLVAENVLHGNFSTSNNTSDKYLKAKSLSLHRYKIKKDIQKEITRLGARVHIVFPEFRRIIGFDSPCALYLLRKYTTPELAIKMDVAYESDKVGHMSRQHFKIEKLPQLVKEAAHSIGIIDGATEEEVEVIKFNLLHVRLLQRRSKAIDKKLLELFKDDRQFEIITSIKGIAARSATLLLAECGGLSQFRYAGQIETMAGNIIKVSESGAMKSVRRQAGIGNKRLRTVIYNICVNLAKNEPRIRKKFLTRQMKRNCYKKNISSLSTMALDLILSLVRHDKLYENNVKYENLLIHIEKEKELRKQNVA